MKITKEIAIREIKKAVEATNKEIAKHGYKVNFDESSLQLDEISPDKKCFFCQVYGDKKEEVSLKHTPIQEITKYDKVSELKQFEEDAHCHKEFCHILKHYKPAKTEESFPTNMQISMVLGAIAVGIGIVIVVFKYLGF